MSKFYTNVSRYGNHILYRGIDNGKHVMKKVKFQPTLYIGTETSPEGMTDMHGNNVTSKLFETMSDAKQFIDKYSNVSGFSIYGMTNYVAQYIQDTFPGEIKFNSKKINIAYIDIEIDITDGYADMETADKPLSSLVMKFSNSDIIHVFGSNTFGKYDPLKTELDIDPANILYYHCNDEEELLRAFVRAWSDNYPDVVTGWNTKFFDIPYLAARIGVVLGQAFVKRLSPWGLINRRDINMFGKPHPTYEIVGISSLDYMDVFKKFGFKYLPQETFKLDHIAHVVLDEKKLSYEEYGSLNDLLKHNYQKYVDYNIKDTLLIERMEKMTALLELTFDMAYRGGVNYTDTMGTTGIWDSILYRYMTDEKIVVPLQGSPSNVNTELAGGYVKEPIPGLYDDVASFDLDSLYPHLMMQYNMSPETHVPGARINLNKELILDGKYSPEESEYAYAANGAAFSKTNKGIIPTIIDGYYAQRSQVKKEMLAFENSLENDDLSEEEKIEVERNIVQLHNTQMSIKILMNALYGAWGNKYFRYYVFEIAEAITTSGQLSVQWAEKTINDYMNNMLKTKEKDYVIYADTDSCYVNMNPLVKEVFKDKTLTNKEKESFLDKVCQSRINKLLSDSYGDLATTMKAYANRMNMKRENICNRALFVAKKRYIMSVLNSEGTHYEEPKIKVTGIEAVRSSTPQVCREKLKESFKVIMTEDERAIQKFIADFKTEFKELPVEDIAKPTGTNSIEEYMADDGRCKPRCPIHVRGAITYNAVLKENNLERQYETIMSGDKIKFVYMKLPNPARENVIGFPSVLPREMKLHDYVDYNLQFEKVFETPIRNILNILNWEVEEKDSLDDFFS